MTCNAATKHSKEGCCIADQSCLYMLPCKHLLSMCFQLVLCMTTATACAAMTCGGHVLHLLPLHARAAATMVHITAVSAEPVQLQSSSPFSLHHRSRGLSGQFAEAEGGLALQQRCRIQQRLLTGYLYIQGMTGPIYLLCPSWAQRSCK